MKTTVKFTAFMLLLMLTTGMSGRALNATDEECPFVSGQVACSFTQDEIHDASIMDALTSSDMELGCHWSAERENLTNGQRYNRRLFEMQCFIKSALQVMSLRENCLSLDKNKITPDNTHVPLAGCDYYIFALRHILI